MYSCENHYSTSLMETDTTFESGTYKTLDSVKASEDPSYQATPTCTGTETEISKSNSSASAREESIRHDTGKRLKNLKEEEERRPLWIGLGVFMTLVVIFSIILHPIDVEDPPLASVGSNLTLRRIKGSFYEGLGVELRVLSLSNTSWGLGFDIMEQEEKIANVFLYHDLMDENFDEDVDMHPNISLWITCLKKKNPLIKYLDTPWNKTWKYLQTNDMRVAVSQTKILVETLRYPEAEELDDCSTTESVEDLRIHLKCWAVKEKCPGIILDPNSEVSYYNLHTVTTVGVLVSTAAFLGFMIAWFWLNYVGINPYLIFFFFFSPSKRLDIKNYLSRRRKELTAIYFTYNI